MFKRTDMSQFSLNWALAEQKKLDRERNLALAACLAAACVIIAMVVL